MRQNELFGVYNSRWTPVHQTPDFISVRTFVSPLSAPEQTWDVEVMLATSCDPALCYRCRELTTGFKLLPEKQLKGFYFRREVKIRNSIT